jgi:hypothetical protein
MNLKIPKEYKKSLPYIISALLLIALSCNFIFDDLLIETLNRIIPLIIISTIILSIPLKNIRDAFYYSVIGVIILEIVYYARLYKIGNDVIIHNKGGDYAIKRSKRKQRIWEGYEGSDEEHSSKDIESSGEKNDDNKEDDDSESKTKESFNNEDTSKLLNEYVKSMSTISELNEDETILINDNEDDDDVLKKLYKNNKKTKDYSPMEAQLATYQMIDNIKELDTLMNKLTPTLKIGHNLMKNFEKFGFSIKK